MSAILAYGASFHVRHIMPWGEHKNIKNWWERICSPMDMDFNGIHRRDENGDKKDHYDFKQELMLLYVSNLNKWWTDNPIPVSINKSGMSDAPTIISVKSSTFTTEKVANVDPRAPVHEMELSQYMEFMEAFGFSDYDPKWMLVDCS